MRRFAGSENDELGVVSPDIPDIWKNARRWVVIACVLFMVPLIAFGWVVWSDSGTVSIGTDGWVFDRDQMVLRPRSKQWMGFEVGEPRLLALEHACSLVASRVVAPRTFACLTDKNRVAGLDMSDEENPMREMWDFRPRLSLGQRHCFGLTDENLTVYLEAGRVKDIWVDCGHIVIDM